MWLHVKYNSEIILKLFQNNSTSHVTTVYWYIGNDMTERYSKQVNVADDKRQISK